MQTLTRIIQDVQVFDAAEVQTKPEITAEGFLTCDVDATRAGIFLYADENGLPVRALRPESEVFNPASMGTLPHKPVTRTHPTDLLNADTARGAMVGSTGDSAIRVENKLRTTATVFDGPTVQAIQGGKVEVSCGYLADVHDEPGDDPTFGPYDVIQRNIRYNHLAVAIDEGRGGPEVRMLLDSAALASKQEETVADPKKDDDKKGLVKLQLGDDCYDVAPELAKAIQVHLDKLQAGHEEKHKELAAHIKELTTAKDDDDGELESLASANEGEGSEDDDKASAKMDSVKATSPAISKIKKTLQTMRGTLKTLRAEVKTRMDAASPEKLAEQAQAQAKLVAIVCALDSKAIPAELFKKPAIELKKLAILSRNPKADLKDKSEAYLDGQFDGIASSVQPNVSRALGEAMLGNAEAAAGNKFPESKTKDAWKSPLTASSRAAAK